METSVGCADDVVGGLSSGSWDATVRKKSAVATAVDEGRLQPPYRVLTLGITANHAIAPGRAQANRGRARPESRRRQFGGHKRKRRARYASGMSKSGNKLVLSRETVRTLKVRTSIRTGLGGAKGNSDACTATCFTCECPVPVTTDTSCTGDVKVIAATANRKVALGDG